MKKTILLLVFAFLFTASSFAQIKINLMGGAQLPTGDFKTLYKMGFGGTAGVEFAMKGSDIAIFGAFGYNSFSVSDDFKALITAMSGNPDDYKMTVMTFGGGVRYFFVMKGSKFLPYIGAQAGLMSFKISASGSSSESAFMWAPQAGFRVEMSPNGTALDVQVSYNSASKNGATTSFIGINGGVAIGLN